MEAGARTGILVTNGAWTPSMVIRAPIRGLRAVSLIPPKPPLGSTLETLMALPETRLLKKRNLKRMTGALP